MKLIEAAAALSIGWTGTGIESTQSKRTRSGFRTPIARASASSSSESGTPRDRTRRSCSFAHCAASGNSCSTWFRVVCRSTPLEEQKARRTRRNFSEGKKFGTGSTSPKNPQQKLKLRTRLRSVGRPKPGAGYVRKTREIGRRHLRNRIYGLRSVGGAE